LALPSLSTALSKPKTKPNASSSTTLSASSGQRDTHSQTRNSGKSTVYSKAPSTPLFKRPSVAALGGNLRLQDGTLLDRIQSDVALCYGLRNNGAHNTRTAPTIWKRYPEVQQGVFRTLFATVDYLYP
jgi:hypothetical protein